ncbi:hypothetical protein [Tellurirhabdus rosea]|uniref:hypothetical protein n=1 Tax=Tellurirhabdus rosea TaxID=2674997 RepID=UPI002253DB77|nr:hypothetical protein [Tellurirhabdus rosea]
MYNNEFEFGNEMEFGNEYGQETAAYEFSNEAEMNQELHESLEMELAHELLNVNSEQEMNYFLGKMFKSIGRGVRNFANSSVGKALGGALKSVAKKALPIAGSALGGMLGGPAGAMIGGKLAGAASNLFELELEGLSPEDREFEVARAYVRFANDAIQNAARLTQTNPGINPQSVANKAINQAAAEYAPGLLRPGPAGQNGRPTGSNGAIPTRGSWIRRGNRITLYI